ncbi:MAG: amino acid ABC transporter permease [Anaerolineales bacterium]|nr:amino acid ABC transporter permease [Anaerolineales bacterium]
MTSKAEEIRPPEPPGLLTWMRHNLFSSWFNALLTIISVAFIFFAVRGIVNWVFFTADWTPVLEFPLLYMIGQYPRDQMWRIAILLWTTTFLFGVSWGLWGDLVRPFAITIGVLLALAAFFPTSSESYTLAVRVALIINPILIFVGYQVGRLKNITGRLVVIAWLVLFIITPILLRGFNESETLPIVETTLWGGLVVTILLAAGGIILSFPIGVALALGRRSSLPVVKIFSTLFIEVVRGVPLVTILFMFSIILALFLPPESRLDRLMRALMAMTVFSAAYMAENVRGGLQAVPPGQEEAGKAVGLNNLKIMTFIVLPQALRLVIPAIVGQFISLFKDTTLAIIVGISELLFIGKSIINSDPTFIQRQLEVFLFIAFLFWIISYAMSSASRQLESQLGVGER